MLLLVIAVSAAGIRLYGWFRVKVEQRWREGFACWEKGDYRSASEKWSNTFDGRVFTKRPAKFLYWKMRAHEKLGEMKEERALREKLLKRYPLDFYSFLVSDNGGITSDNRGLLEKKGKKDFARPSWDGVVKRVSEKTGVPDYLIWAVIKTESRFRKDAVSKSGAVGLMQLMPDTAREVAKSRNLSGYSLEEPYDNILLGACYLKLLLERFGNIALAAAAYNAGATSVRQWEKCGTGDMAAWIEKIPYPQTKQYVKHVLEYAETYRLICGKGSRTSIRRLLRKRR